MLWPFDPLLDHVAFICYHFLALKFAIHTFFFFFGILACVLTHESRPDKIQYWHQWPRNKANIFQFHSSNGFNLLLYGAMTWFNVGIKTTQAKFKKMEKEKSSLLWWPSLPLGFTRWANGLTGFSLSPGVWVRESSSWS